MLGLIKYKVHKSEGLLPQLRQMEGISTQGLATHVY